MNKLSSQPDLLDQLVELLTELTSRVPASSEPAQDTPDARVRQLTLAASSQAGAVAGALSLPPGPLGMLTVLPDLLAVWHIQRQLVADIAAVYGKTAELGNEAMVYCLFRHAAAQVVRQFVVRLGQRTLLRHASVAAMERSLQRIGVALSRRAVARAVSRWIPIAGAVGIGAYAFYDTMRVGRTARELFAAVDGSGADPVPLLAETSTALDTTSAPEPAAART